MRQTLYSLVLLTGIAVSANGSTVSNIQLIHRENSTIARIDVAGGVKFTHQTEVAKDGKADRIIVDVLESTHGLGLKSFTNLPVSMIKAIRSSQYSTAPESVVRIVFDVRQAPVYKVESDNNSISVIITDLEAPPFNDWSSAEVSRAAAIAVALVSSTEKSPTSVQPPPPAVTATQDVKQLVAVPAESSKSNKEPVTASTETVPLNPSTEILKQKSLANTVSSPSESTSAGSAIDKDTSMSLEGSDSPSQIAVLPNAPKTKDDQPKPDSPNAAWLPIGTVTVPANDSSKPTNASESTSVKTTQDTTPTSQLPSESTSATTLAVPAETTKSVPKAEHFVGGPLTESELTSVLKGDRTDRTPESEVENLEEPSVESESEVPALKGSKKVSETKSKPGVSSDSDAKVAPSQTQKAAPAKTDTSLEDDSWLHEPALSPTESLQEEDSVAARRSTARFRRDATSNKMKGTMVAEFPQRLVIKYSSKGVRDPFATLIDDEATQNSPIEIRIPNVEGLKLVGVIESAAGTANRALFEDKDGYSYILKSGDKVRNGYVLRVELNEVYFQIFEYGWSRTLALKIDEI